MRIVLENSRIVKRLDLTLNGQFKKTAEFYRYFFNKSVRSLPWVQRKLNAELERIRQEMEDEVHQHDKVIFFIVFEISIFSPATFTNFYRNMAPA